MEQEELDRLWATPGTRPTVRGAELRTARPLKTLEMEDYVDRLELERARRVQLAPTDHQPAISLTVDQHPVIMLPQRDPQALPVTFVGGVDRPASIVVSPIVSQMLPPQGLALEDSRVGAPARRELLGDDAHGEALRIRDLQDAQSWGSHQDALYRLGAPPFVPAAQGPINFPWPDS